MSLLTMVLGKAVVFIMRRYMLHIVHVALDLDLEPKYLHFEAKPSAVHSGK
jgi:hypothetical protein